MALLTRHIRCAAMLVLLAAGLPPAASAGETIQLHEEEIKAGLLYNFLKYIDWPIADRLPAVTVCIFGDDPFDGYLQPMAGRTVNQREIAIHTIHDIQEAKLCHLLFVNADQKNRWPQLSKFLDHQNVLTVSDFAGFADNGGMIEFGLKNDHIDVLLNMKAVTAAQLHVQDRLLKLVTVVHADAPEGGR